MAIPILVGYPLIASILSGLFGSLVTFFTQYLTKRLALVLAAVAALIIVTGTFFAALEALAAAVVPALPPYFAQGYGHIMPSNTTLCLSTIFSAHVVRYAYEWHVKVIQYKLF